MKEVGLVRAGLTLAQDDSGLRDLSAQTRGGEGTLRRQIWL